MNILLLNPPFLAKFSREQRSPAVTKSGTFYYPMWLAFAAEVLDQKGHQVKLLDCPASGMEWEQLVPIIREFGPSLVVIDTSTPSIFSDVETGAKIKAMLPDSFVILVGPHVSA